ncbi:hypothetical protein M422DRAFT_39192, partial [Sphaerobolus stellatus SS14]
MAGTIMLLAWLNVWMARPSFNTGVYLLSLYVPKLTSLSARIINEGPSPRSSNPYSPSSSAPYNLLRPLFLRAIAPPILHNDLLITRFRRGAFGVVRSLVVIICGIVLRRKPEKGEAYGAVDCLNGLA